MLRELLHSNEQEFIRTYQGEVTTLALKGSPFKNIPTVELIQQIEGFRKTKQKLSIWHEVEGIYYPPKIHLEQTSSQTTAAYKASLVQGDSLADLTGGYGIDGYYFSKSFDQVHHFEQNELLSKIAKHNFELLDSSNVSCFMGDSLEGIKNKTYHTIYIDPARRHKSKGKVFFLKDCEPNVVTHFDYIMERCETMMVKTSPMLDISVGLSELKNVDSIHIVAVENEVKELLWICKKNRPVAPPTIFTINLGKEHRDLFHFEYGIISESSFHRPGRFLYEPNAAILKSGAFMAISEAYGVHKLHKNSHLYTSEALMEFPGRRFQINDIIPYNKKHVRSILGGTKANITIRNFPETVQQLRKKWSIIDGGNRYLFFTTLLHEEKVVIDCTKVDT